MFKLPWTTGVRRIGELEARFGPVLDIEAED